MMATHAAIPWASVALLRGLATLFVVAGGFATISDDDYARVVIAQSFIENPSLDPSGTSWLPFPFWLYGAVMTLFGPSLDVARGLAFALSISAALLVHTAARWSGFPPFSAWLGAVFAAVLPHAVWLGAAPVPEGFSAALCLLGVASLTQRHDAQREPDVRRWIGAVALVCATLSRYEAWPIAAVFAADSLRDAMGQRRVKPLWPALLVLAAPLAWVLHGVLHHGNALFFVQRVAAYQSALGVPARELLGALINTPLLLVRAEPELTLAGLFTLVCVCTGSKQLAAPHWPPIRRLLVASLSLLAFLVLGDLRGSSPTHHAERPLLFAWLVLCLIQGHVVFRLRTHRSWLSVAGAVTALLILLVPEEWRHDPFIDRQAEVEIGKQARAPAGKERLLIDTGDYGYFAVMAGFERVAQTEPLVRRDPRFNEPDPWTSRETLTQRMRTSGARWLIVERQRLPGTEGWLQPRLETEKYALVRLETAQ